MARLPEIKVSGTSSVDSAVGADDGLVNTACMVGLVSNVLSAAGIWIAGGAGGRYTKVSVSEVAVFPIHWS